MKDFAIKGFITVIFTGAALYFHQLVGPLIILAIVMVADYITGMAAAWVNSELSSRAGIVGIVKKIGYLFAVAVAIVVDYVVQTAAAGAGMEVGNFHVFGLLVTIWLILNECLSILENLSEIGVPLPAFLVAVVKKLKKSAEKTGETHAGDIPAQPEAAQTAPDAVTAALAAAAMAGAADKADPYADFGEDGTLPPPFNDETPPTPQNAQSRPKRSESDHPPEDGRS